MKDTIYVWDPIIRLFHWLLVSAYMISYLTGDSGSSLHIYSGYLILGLLLLRIVWGFIGGQHARFRDFIYPPVVAFRYLRDLMLGRKTRFYPGHNPAGGWMVLMLLTTLGLTGITGLLAYEDEQATTTTQRVMANNERKDEKNAKHHEGIWEELHEGLSSLSLLLVALHLAGVYLSNRRQGGGLISAMIDGYKRHEKTINSGAND